MSAPRRRWLPRVLLVSLVALSVGLAGLLRFAYRVDDYGVSQSLDRVYRLADKGQIVWAELLDEDAQVVGEVCSAPIPDDPDGPRKATRRCPLSARAGRFHASYPRSDVATQVLIERIADKSPVVVDKQTAKGVAKLVATFLFPLLILANLFALIFLSAGGDSSIGDIVGFGSITRKRAQRRRAVQKVTFADVAGASEAVAELREVTDYLADPKKFEAYGAAAPRGVLLFGPPGCGKTLLARAVAGESGVPFLSISGAEFVESLVGVGAARVRDLFRQVREVAPAIVFIDEIDAVGRSREGEGASGEREQTLNQLLVEMDGFDVSAGIVVMGATNRPDILDPALLRPGRFDRHVTLDPPEVHGRQAILELHAAGKPIAADVDFEGLARATPGFTGADLANVINEGALVAIRQGHGGQIQWPHLTEAVQRVLHGPQRRGRLLTAEERKRIAFHESGHALVAAALGQRDQVQRVSVVARGRGLGQSVMADDGERVLLTRGELEAQLAVAMAGVAAEELCFGESSTTAEHDVDRANFVARQMVGRYGMSDQMGRLRVLHKGDDYLGGAPVMDAVSGQTMVEFDHEVRRLIAAGEARAAAALTLHREHLDRLAERLEVEETLDGPALDTLLAPVRPELNLYAGVGMSAGTNGTGRARPRRKPAQS